MTAKLLSPALRPIFDKVQAGQRVTDDDALQLYGSIDLNGQPSVVETFGRHDPCVGIRATPIAEAMLALVLMDHALRHRAQNGDVQIAVAPIAGTAPR